MNAARLAVCDSGVFTVDTSCVKLDFSCLLFRLKPSHHVNSSLVYVVYIFSSEFDGK